jgi:hypothetical protein
VGSRKYRMSFIKGLLTILALSSNVKGTSKELEYTAMPQTTIKIPGKYPVPASSFSNLFMYSPKEDLPHILKMIALARQAPVQFILDTALRSRVKKRK